MRRDAIRVEIVGMADEPRMHMSLIDRRISKIVNARSVTLGLATTFFLLSLVAAVVMRIFDHHDFPSLGLAVWWSLQTVTTVGYGDIVPTTHIGRVIGGAELVLSISFIAFLTAGVTSTVIHNQEARAKEADRSKQAADSEAILDALTQARTAIEALDSRLESIEAKLPTR
jgi:voltage-gated potassium channel